MSADDQAFRTEFEACTYPPVAFDHRAHLRLAYTCLCEQDTDSAYESVRRVRNPPMLDAKIMLTHYSAELLFSDAARGRFVEPDLDPIPKYEPQPAR